MIETQRIIKYVAIGLALLLTVNIISTIMYGIISVGTVFTSNDNNDNYNSQELNDLEINDNTISKLNIDIISSNIIIKESTSLKVETNNQYIDLKEKNNQLFITEEKHNWLNNTTSDLVIYIPSNHIFDNVSIENGAGKIEVETLNTKKINFDLGAGKVEINNLIVSSSTEIDGGAGEIIITNSNINNLDLDIGAGKVTITSIITGNSEIDAGVGALNLNLVGIIDNYKIVLDKGLGNATIDNEKMQSNVYYGTGLNLIDISGGIGNIKINFTDNK